MEKHLVICIGRQFGSGGHEIAVKTANQLGIKVYERELIRLACEYGELSEKAMSAADEKATNPYLFQTVHEGNYHVLRGRPTSEVLFALQSHEIRRLAKREECVFVGRCADYILKDNPDAFHIFVHAAPAFRADRIVRLYGESEKKPEERLRDKDTRRKVNYKHFTGREWGRCQNYHLSLDSGVIGVEKCVSMIVELVRSR